MIALAAYLSVGSHPAWADAKPIQLSASDLLTLVQDDGVTAPAPRKVAQKPAGPLPNGAPLAMLYRNTIMAPPMAFLAQAPVPPPVAIAKSPPVSAPPAAIAMPAKAVATATPTPIIAAPPAKAVAAPAPAVTPSAVVAPPVMSPPAPAATPIPDVPDSATDATGTQPITGDAESLREAIVSSLKSNPDIQIALAKQDDARWGVSEAKAGYMPHVDMTVGYGPEIAKQGAQPGSWNNRLEGTVTVSQNVWDWGTTTNDIKRARASFNAAQWAAREQIESISFDITSAYLGILQQQKIIGLTNEEIVATRKILRMVTVQKDLGLTTQADVDRAKARVENIQSSLLDRQSLLQQTRDAYKRLTDRVPGVATDLPSASPSLPKSVDEAVDMIDGRSPRMAQAVEDRRSLAKQYASQTGTFLPRVGIQLQANHKYDVQGATGLTEDARAMVTLSYSFLNGGSDVAVRNRIGARLRQADYELDRRRREVEQDMRADFESLRAAQQKIATINAEIESAQRVADLYKQQFREGKRSVFDLLDSQQVLFAARSNEVVNEIAMHLAEYRVLQKLGGLFDLVSANEPLPPLVMPAPPPPLSSRK